MKEISNGYTARPIHQRDTQASADTGKTEIGQRNTFTKDQHILSIGLKLCCARRLKQGEPIGMLPGIGPVVFNTIVTISQLIVNGQALEKRSLHGIIITLPPDLFVPDTTSRLIHVDVIEDDPVGRVTGFDDIVTITGQDGFGMITTDHVVGSKATMEVTHISLGADDRNPVRIGF